MFKNRKSKHDNISAIISYLLSKIFGGTKSYPQFNNKRSKDNFIPESVGMQGIIPSYLYFSCKFPV